MEIEKERKFLVKSTVEVYEDSMEHIIQMYLVDREDHSLRIRINNFASATICYKYYLDAESKEEIEYEFSLAHAELILSNKEYVSKLEKTRVKKDGWDIDIYNNDLVVAEYEFSDDNPLPDPLPDWIGEEITGMYEYTNPAIAKRYTELT